MLRPGSSDAAPALWQYFDLLQHPDEGCVLARLKSAKPQQEIETAQPNWKKDVHMIWRDYDFSVLDLISEQISIIQRHLAIQYCGQATVEPNLEPLKSMFS